MPLKPDIEEMNKLVKSYRDSPRAFYSAQHGLVDEVAAMPGRRSYLVQSRALPTRAPDPSAPIPK